MLGRNRFRVYRNARCNRTVGTAVFPSVPFLRPNASGFSRSSHTIRGMPFN
jgi:hypothetical protein